MDEQLKKKVEELCPGFKPPKLKLVGMNGNAFNVLGLADRALRKAGYGAVIPLYHTEALSGDYGRLLQTTMQFCDVR